MHRPSLADRVSTCTRRGVGLCAGVLLLGASAMLAACGSGSTVSDLAPERFVVVGDDFSDVGQLGYRYTVNDGTPIWIESLAGHYGLQVTPASAGGWGYAQGHARVTATDTTSGTNAPSVAQQIDAALARQEVRGKHDVFFVGGGMSDIVDAVQTHGISETTEQIVENAARDLAAQVRRLVAAGATHVVVSGVYNLGSTPWARARHQEDEIRDLTLVFNDRLLIDMVDLGGNVLYFDAAQFFNFIYDKERNWPVDNNRDAVCTTPSATTCTPSTIAHGADYKRWLFADSLHFTPEMMRLYVNEDYGENMYTRFKDRW